MTCSEVRPLLGELLDGELDDHTRPAVESHLTRCAACREALAELRALTAGLGRDPDLKAPAALWDAIESRLDADREAHDPAQHGRPLRLSRYRRALATAASLLLALGLSWVVLNAPLSAPAGAAQLDFRPVLEQANGDIEAGIAALLRNYGGRPITANEAQRLLRVRVAAPATLPGGLRLKSMHILHMGRHHKALAWYYVGEAGQLLLLQCPPHTEKCYGNRECVACRAGPHGGHGVCVGKLRLMHLESSNVCVCVVSTLSESALDAALGAVQIEF